MINGAILNGLSNWIFLAMVVGVPLYAQYRKVKVYETFVGGAKEGIAVMIRIIPHLVAMLVAIGMLRASGAFELLGAALAPILSYVGMPPEVLPLALIRPFSGSAANGMLAELSQLYGGDSFIAKLAATIMGGTETTFYVVAIYFGVVAISRTRYAIPVGLIADAVGVIAALVICRWVFL
ncbi:MAG: spore maturation protein [Legionellales bacterium]|nr:spore maturation protein [Legionellales bacterium]